MDAPFASDLLVAPDGRHLAWIENERGRRNIWIAEAPDWTSRRLTSFEEDDGQEIADLAWAPDASFLLFARGGDFENGGENPNPALATFKPDQSIWRADLKSGAVPVKLTVGRLPQISPNGTIAVFIRGGQIFSLRLDAPSNQGKQSDPAVPLLAQKGSQSDLRWAPDGSAFAFVSSREDHGFIGLYTLSTKSVAYLDPSVDADSEPVWSPDSSQIAFIRIPAVGEETFFSPQRQAQPWSIRVADRRSGIGREVFRAEKGPGSVFHEIVSKQQITWTAQGRLVFPWERTGWLHLYSIPSSGGKPVELTPGQGEVEHVASSPDGNLIYFSTNIGDIDRRHIAAVPSSGGEKVSPVTSGEGIEWEPQPLASNAAAYLCSTYRQKAHVGVRLTVNQTKHLAPNAPSDFPEAALVRPQPVLITAADGMQIHGQLFLPPPGASSGSERHPALIFVHGGSRRQMLLGFHYMYYYSNAYSLNQYFASQGYVVLSINYRSGIGYGLNFREALHYGAAGGSEFQDVVGAGLYLKNRSDVDGSRIGIWGGSYGGYLTAMALSRASDLFAAGVDFHGVHDWSSLRGYLSRGPKNGDPAEAEELQSAARIAFESSPMASVDTWHSPVLLIHGDDDRNVDFAQTVMLVEALRKRNVDFEELIFPNEIHDFLLHQHWVAAYRATADFFARKLSQPALAK